MNKNSSSKITNGKTLAIVLSVAMIAAFSTMGSVMAGSNETSSPDEPADFIAKMPQIQGSIDVDKLLSSSVKTTFADAASTASFAVNDGMVISGNLQVYQGYYVYSFDIKDGDNKMYQVIIDAGNGKVLYTSEGFDHRAFGIGMPDHMFFRAAPIGFGSGIGMSEHVVAISVVPPTESQNK